MFYFFYVPTFPFIQACNARIGWFTTTVWNPFFYLPDIFVGGTRNQHKVLPEFLDKPILWFYFREIPTSFVHWESLISGPAKRKQISS
jgi:hypothetical protein